MYHWLTKYSTKNSQIQKTGVKTLLNEYNLPLAH